MINRCQKLHVQLCSSSRDFATPFLLFAELCPGGSFSGSEGSCGEQLAVFSLRVLSSPLHPFPFRGHHVQMLGPMDAATINEF